jgi:hypothetical protein
MSQYADLLIKGYVCFMCDKPLREHTRRQVATDRYVCSDECETEFRFYEKKFGWDKRKE